tara:strand:- start:240 stop:509 length:270 start_codon:yes stop_codon:yes gene_type:complete
MKVTQLAGSSCWASRFNEAKKTFKRIQINSPEDVSKLTMNDNFFVKGDDVSDDIASALQELCDDIGATLVAQNTDNKSITRLWIAPPMK